MSMFNDDSLAKLIGVLDSDIKDSYQSVENSSVGQMG